MLQSSWYGRVGAGVLAVSSNPRGDLIEFPSGNFFSPPKHHVFEQMRQTRLFELRIHLFIQRPHREPDLIGQDLGLVTGHDQNSKTILEFIFGELIPVKSTLWVTFWYSAPRAQKKDKK